MPRAGGLAPFALLSLSAGADALLAQAGNRIPNMHLDELATPWSTVSTDGFVAWDDQDSPGRPAPQ